MLVTGGENLYSTKKDLLIKMTEKGDAEPEDQSENHYQDLSRLLS